MTAELSRCVALPPLPRRRPEALRQDDFLPRLAHQVEPGSEPERQATPGRPVVGQPRGPAGDICGAEAVNGIAVAATENLMLHR
jgi:hypothetical protein